MQKVQHGRGFALYLASFVMAGSGFAQVNCDGALAEADGHYTSGAFQNAITALAPCVKNYPAGSSQDRAAHRLLALAYLRNGDLEESRLVLVELFARNPDYEPDPINDPPAFVSLVNLVREETRARASEPDVESTAPVRTWFRSSRSWLFIAGGAALTTALVVVAASAGGGDGGGGNPNTLPPPPAFP